ncbi:unnamed protein product, partial [Prorocentrum cordatum]
MPIGACSTFNLPKSTFQTAALYLCDILEPIQRSLQCAMNSTAVLFQRLRSSDCTVFLDTLVLFTADVKDIYPSIRNRHLYSVLADAIDRQYGARSRRGTVAKNLSKITLDNQYIEHHGRLYKVAQGIAGDSGLSSGVFMANVHSNDSDHSVGERNQSDLHFRARFVDDGLGIARCTECLPHTTDTSDSFDRNMRWEIA